MTSGEGERPPEPGQELRSALESRAKELRSAGPPEGFVIRPAKVQVGAIVGAAIVGPLAGITIARWVAPGSEFATFVGFIALPMVLGAGYAVWRAIIASLLFRGISRGLMRAIYQILVKRERPSADEVLPDAARVATFLQESVRASAAFTRVGYLIGITAGLLLAIAAPGSRLMAFVLMFVACALYGRGLAHLARDGYLPMPDE